ncbi:hypothetical protein O6H91_16G086100 [Diphasiastrum complanatum]|uniref:Uncharacterized protein n=1 Tax=Diphasiastrum complanatum TaxID=34168 RepID=A0ACC2BEM7_DIPCM|nr:hypothetical protein O6H91_16G086100 [Diphasiastrum complanatum]
MAKSVSRSAVPPARRTLELFIISAQELRNANNFGGKLNTYAVAYVDPRHKVCTRIDEEGGINPSWDQKLSLTIDQRLLEDVTAQLTIEIYCPGTWKDKLLGTARVSISDAVKIRGGPKFPVTSIVLFHDSRPQGMLNICIPPALLKPHVFEGSGFRGWEKLMGVRLRAE